MLTKEQIAEMTETRRRKREAGTLRLTTRRAIKCVAMWNSADDYYSRCSEDNGQIERYTRLSYVIDAMIDRFRINPSEVPAANVAPSAALDFIDRTNQQYAVNI